MTSYRVLLRYPNEQLSVTFEFEGSRDSFSCHIMNLSLKLFFFFCSLISNMHLNKMMMHTHAARET